MARADRPFAELDSWLDRLLAAPVHERAEILARCTDAALRSELERMLADDSAIGPLDRMPAELLTRALDEEQHSRTGSILGGYRLLELIGEGGMAAVWSAERSDGAIERKVAVKCLKIGLTTPSLHARFLREQQILARLVHPNIARLYDAGVSADGVPYIVMERIDGEPITQWCDARRLPLRSRIELFRSVLAAVAYAHQNLIVHRDLKPANILVTRDGTPKLLDFGIAKLLDTQDATRTQTRALTPGYAAPEQIEDGPTTTATDVYALGVILYELLCGQRPSATGSPLPSMSALQVRSESSADRLEDAAQARGFTTRAALSRALRGDLDTLTATALQHDPARRYAGAAEFDGDIERWLQRRPLRARRDSAVYRIGKFARRNWIAVSAISAVVVALSIGIALALWQAQQAERSAQRAEAVKDFLLGIFDAAQSGPRGSTVLTNRELAERAATSLRERLASDADTNAQLLMAVGRVYRKMSLNDQAIPLFERAVAIQRDARPNDPLALADALAALAEADDATGEYAQAKAGYDEALALQREHAAPTERVADTLIGAAMVDIDLGKNEARDTIDAAMQELAKISAPPMELKLRALMVRAAILRRAGDPDGSVAASRTALAFARSAFGDDAPQSARAWNVLGTALRQTGQLDEAEQALRELIRYDRDIAHQIEPSHLYSLGTLQIDLGDYASAVDTLRQSLEIERITTGADVMDLGSFEEPLARALLQLNRLDEAEALARDAVARYERAGPEATGELAQMRLTLADVLDAHGQHAQSLPLYVEVLGAVRDPHTKRGREQRLFAQLGQVAARTADANATETANALAMLLDSPDFAAVTDPLSRLRALTAAADISLGNRAYTAAEAQARSALTVAEHLPPNHPQTARARLICAEALLAQHRVSEAEELMAAATAPLAARYPQNHPLRLRAEMLAKRLRAQPPGA